MVIEIVGLPINSMVFFHSYVSLPEGISYAYDSNSVIFGVCPLVQAIKHGNRRSSMNRVTDDCPIIKQ